MEHRAYYAIIPAEVRYANIPNGAKLLYGEITALANEKGYSWASNAYFSELYQVGTRTIKRWINILEQNGFIGKEIIYKEDSKEVDERHLYIISPSKLSKGSDKNVTRGGDNNDTRGSDKNVTRGGDKNVTYNNTYINNTKKSVSKDTLEKDSLSETSSDPFSQITNEQLAIELKESAEDLRVEQIAHEYNRVCTKLPQIKKLSPQRRKKVKARLKSFSEEDIYKSFSKAAESKFINGSNNQGWKASFDWFFANDENILKVLEGNFDNTKAPPKNKFNNFPQRNYDFVELEKKLYGG